jgi:acetylornithine deacetylase/succinyl-diaminopimelate desuccinylase-like protein
MTGEPERSPRWLDELSEFLSIPSVSADPAHGEDVVRAGDWICEFLRRAGGDADWAAGYEQHLLAGEIPASTPGRQPTVLLYGHFDVQPPDPVENWHSPPFTPTVMNGGLYARGVVDDKGQLFALLKAVEELAKSRALPVRVRVVCDGEEEIGGRSIADFLSNDSDNADVCVIYDTSLAGSGRPTFIVGTRGFVYLHLDVRSGTTDLHSGIYGGAALNAMHALLQSVTSVLPADGRLPAPLREGVIPPGNDELRSWVELSPETSELARLGARPADAAAADEFHIRTFAEPSVDVHGITGGSADLMKTVIPAEARANLSVRLVPDQDPKRLASILEELLREAAPEGAEVDVTVRGMTPPARIDADSAPIRLALDAVEAVTGSRPLLTRWGASLPVVSALASRSIPTVLSGFAPPDSNMHAPNEWMPLSSIETAITAAKAMLTAWGSELG